METLREKIISLELSNAEDDVESITGTGASDGESESEDTAGQNTTAVVEEKTDSQDATDVTPAKTAKTDVTPTKKKKRKRSKKSRHWWKIVLFNESRYKTFNVLNVIR